MAVITVELVSRREGLVRPVFGGEGVWNLGNREGRSSEVDAVAVSAGLQVALGIIVVGIHPRLSQRVNPVGAAVRCHRYVGMADGAFGDLGDVPLHLRGIHAVICLQCGILRVRRTVAG